MIKYRMAFSPCRVAAGLVFAVLGGSVTLAAQSEADRVQDLFDRVSAASTIDEFTEAVGQCQKAEASGLSGPNQAYVKRLLSWIYNRRGEAYADQAATAMESDDADTAVELDARALADFEKAVEYDGTHVKAIHNRGVNYALQSKFEQAIADFGRVLELKPDYANARYNLGEIRLELGQLDQAVDDYSEAVRLDPKDTDALTGRGHALMRKASFSEALRDFRRVVELAPDDADSYANRGDAYQKLKMWEQAAGDFRRAIQLDESSARAYQGAAWLMATCPDPRFRQAEFAVQAAGRAIELLGSEDAQYLDTLAAAHANAGQFEEAIAASERALKAPSDKELQTLIKQRRELYLGGKPFRQSAEPEQSDSSASSP